MTAATARDAGLVSRYEDLVGILDGLLATDTSPASDDEVFAAAKLQEVVSNKVAALGTRRIVELTDRGIPAERGYPRARDFLTAELHIPDAGKRLAHAKQLESMYALTGEKLPPVSPNLAEAAAEGAAAPAHVDAAIKVLDKIPAKVDADTRAAAEEMMAQFAREHSPADITRLGTRLLAHLDPDGKLTDDADRQRRRKLTVAPQDADLMSNLTGCLDPTTRAMFDVVLAAWAAPGMNNPDDEQSLTGSREQHSAQVVEEAKKRDLRSPSQRNHDALKALLQAALDGGLLGKSHRGLPPHLIISITESELRERTGLGQTTTGALLPMDEVLHQAAQAQHHLAVFEDHTNRPLYYGRSERLASQAQRFTLFAKYGGCSHPGCTSPFSHTDIHHTPDYSGAGSAASGPNVTVGGKTDASDMAPACGPHNRIVTDTPGGWSTTLITPNLTHHDQDWGFIGWQRNPDPHTSLPPPKTLPHNNITHRLGIYLHRHIQAQQLKRATNTGPDGGSAGDPP